MSMASMNSNISQYSQVNRISGVTEADPHRLVLMLLDGALGKIAMVKGLMMRKDIAKKGEMIGQAIAIIGGLKASLDKKSGGEIAGNLNDIYEYAESRLLTANIKNDVGILDEVSKLLHEIKSGWEAIPLEIRNKSASDLSVVS